MSFYVGEIGGLFSYGFLFLFFLFVVKVVFVSSPWSESDEDTSSEVSGGALKQLLVLLLLFVVIVFSSKFLIASTVQIAQIFGVSDSLVAFFLLAFGTSLPELAVSAQAARKNQVELLIGNIIGSNISNILLVLGLASIFAPIPINSDFSIFGLSLGLCFAIIFAAIAFCSSLRSRPVSRLTSGSLLLVYVLVCIYLAMA